MMWYASCNVSGEGQTLSLEEKLGSEEWYFLQAPTLHDNETGLHMILENRFWRVPEQYA